MLPVLSLSLHDDAAETGPPVRRERNRSDADPYKKKAVDVVPVEYVKLPKNEKEANNIVDKQWKQESFLGKGNVGRYLWNSIREYGAEALHKHFWTIAREDKLAELNMTFPPGTVTAVDSIADLFRWESQIVLSMMLPNLLEIRDDLKEGRPFNTSGSQYFWMFSCHPEWNDGKIQVLCAGPETPYKPLVEHVTAEYAFRRSDSLPPDSCGNYNCFFGNVPVERTRAAPNVVARAIKQFQPMDSSAFPSSTAVRAPNSDHKTFYEKYETFDAMFEEVSELFLSLHMAQLGITPPVYAAVPVFKRETDWKAKYEVDLKRTTHFGFAYMGEDEWSSLYSLLNTELSQPQMTALGTAILKCVRATSDNFVLLLDVKSPNMIVKPTMDSTAYEVRMIDFGSVFSVDVNRFGYATKVPTTSSDCVFFVNGLLLLNYAYYPHRSKRKVFADLILEVAATWATMKELDHIYGFCGYLAQDKMYAAQFTPRTGRELDFKPKNLSFVEEEEFFKQLSQVFYVVLANYGRRDGGFKNVHVGEMAPPAWLIISYVERILNELKGATGWLDGDADDARLRSRIDAMKAERAPIMLD